MGVAEGLILADQLYWQAAHGCSGLDVVMQVEVFAWSAEISWLPALGDVDEEDIELVTPGFQRLDRAYDAVGQDDVRLRGGLELGLKAGVELAVARDPPAPRM